MICLMLYVLRRFTSSRDMSHINYGTVNGFIAEK